MKASAGEEAEECLSEHHSLLGVLTSKGWNSLWIKISNRFLFMNGNTSKTYPSRLNQARISVIELLLVNGIINAATTFHQNAYEVSLSFLSLALLPTHIVSLAYLSLVQPIIRLYKRCFTCFFSKGSQATATVLHLPKHKISWLWKDIPAPIVLIMVSIQ